MCGKRGSKHGLGFSEVFVSLAWRLLFLISEKILYVINNKEAVFGFTQSCVQAGVLLPELPNFMQYYTWRDVHVVCMHTHVICRSGYIICMSSTGGYIICMSSATLLMVTVDLNYLSTLTGTGY